MTSWLTDLDERLNDSHWRALFGRGVASAFPIGRRGFLLAGLASLATAGTRFESLMLELRHQSLVIKLGGNANVVPLGQYGHKARFEVARDGSAWRFRAYRLNSAPLAPGAELDLRFSRQRGSWHVAGKGGMLGPASAVPLTDWLSGLTGLQFETDVNVGTLRHVNLGPGPMRMSLFADGTWRGSARNPVTIEVDGLRVRAMSVRWVPRTPRRGWVFHADNPETLDDTKISAALGAERNLRVTPANISRFAVEITRGARALLYIQGGVRLHFDTSGRGAAIEIADSKMVRVVSLRERPTRILVDLANATGTLDLEDVTFALRGRKDRFSALAIRNGRAAPFDMELLLARASLPIEDSDLVDWEFPATPLRLNVRSTYRPSEASSERLFLATSGDNEASSGDPVPGFDPENPDDPISGVMLGGADETFTIDAQNSLLRVLRSRDLLDLKFGFSGLYFSGTGVAGQLPELRVRGQVEVPPALVVHFGAQHVYEWAEDAQVHDDGSVTWSDGEGPDEIVEARASGPSRLVFDLVDKARIPLTVGELTAWSDLSLRVTGRAFKPGSDVLEQLDYVGIRPGTTRSKAMELLRSSIEADRDLEDPNPGGDQYLETVLELRFNTFVSPSREGSHPEAVQSHPDELASRGAQLFSTRLRPRNAMSLPPVNGKEDDEDDAADDDAVAAATRQAISREEPHDLRVVWAKGMDLGFLSGRAIPEEDKASWTSTRDGRNFPAAHSMQDARELAMNTSWVALNAVLGLVEVKNQDVAQEDPSLGEGEKKYQAVPGQVVPQPDGYAFVDNGTLVDGKRPPDAGVAVATTLGHSRVVMTSQGASFATTSGFTPFAPYYLKKVDPTLDEPSPPDDWHAATTMEKFEAYSVLGRDIRVTVASKGYMFPLGHRASLIKLSERMFMPHASRKPGAREQDPTSYLVRRHFLVIGRPDKAFPSLGQPFDGRAGLALSSIRMLTTRSPDLLNPRTAVPGTVAVNGRIKTGAPSEAGLVFWPRIRRKSADTHGTDVFFEYLRDDEDTPLKAPLIFADNAAVHHAPTMRALAEMYRSSVPVEQRQILAPGKAFKYAPGRRRDETAFETVAIDMSVSGRAQADDETSPVKQGSIPGLPSVENFAMDGVMEGADQPPFYGVLETARARVQSVNRLLSRSAGTVELGMNPLYVAHGFDTVANPSEVFLNVKTRTLFLDLASDGTASGGIAKPNMRIAQLSRTVGPIGGPALPLPTPSSGALRGMDSYPAERASSTALATTPAEAGRFDPLDMLGGALNDAKILGLISLKDVLKVVSLATGAPKLLESVAYEFGEAAGAVDLTNIKRIAEETLATLDRVIVAFLESVDAAIAKLQSSDLSLSDFYPELDRALHAVEPAGLGLVTQIDESISKVGEIDDPNEAKTRLAKEYTKITGKIGELAAAVESVRNAAEAVIDNPVPAIVGETITLITAQWNILRATVTGDLLSDLKADLERHVKNGLLNELRKTLPVPSQANPTWEHFYAVFFGFPRPYLDSTAQEEALKRRNSQLLEEVKADYASFVSVDGQELGQEVTQLLKYHGDSLVAQHFGLPLSKAIEALIAFEKALKDSSAEAREALIGKLTDLVVKATQAILNLGYLQRVSELLQDAQDFCEKATKILVDGSEGLTAEFDRAEVEIQKVRSALARPRIPAQFGDLDAARARALIAANEVMELVGEGRGLNGELREAIAGKPCASISELDPVTQLFRLRSRALDRVRDLASAMADIQRQIKDAFAQTVNAPESLVRGELDAMEKALKDALLAIKGALKALIGASDFKVEDFKTEVAALKTGLEVYKSDLGFALSEFEIAFKSLSNRIGSIDHTNPEVAVAEVNAVAQETINFVAKHSKPLAGWLTMSGGEVQDLVKGWANWAEEQAKAVLEIALTVDRTAISVLENVLDAIQKNQGLEILIRAEVTEALSSSLVGLRAEELRISALVATSPFDVFAAGMFVKGFWVENPPPVLGAVALMQKLADSLLNGRLSALVDLRGLRNELESAILDILPTRVNLSYDWATEIGNYPASNPVFLITPKQELDDRYWKVDGPVSGEQLRKKFYPVEDKPAQDHLIIEAGAGINLVNGEREARAEGYLHPFTVNILPGFADIVTLKFSAATFGAGSGRSSKFRATPVDVTIGDDLSYIQALGSFLSGGGEQGPYYEITLLPPTVEVGFRLSLDQVVLGALIFYNISLNISAELPLDDRDARFRFTFARRELPFIISVPPYGGGGHVGCTANLKGIVGFEASIEFGAMVGLSFGPIKGYGQITAGIYIAKTADGLTIIRGFVRALGEGTIAIFSLAVCIEIALESKNGEMTGTTFISLTFKVKFVEFNYSFDAEYNISGRSEAERNEYRLHAVSGEESPNATGTVTVDQPSEVAAWSRYRSLYGANLLNRGWDT